MKKVLSLFFVFVLLVTLFCGCSSSSTDLTAKPGESANGFMWEDNYSEIVITGYEGDSKNLEIPTTINSKPVTHIASRAFANFTDLESVIINDNIKGMGEEIFRNCSSLKSLIIPESVQVFCMSNIRDCLSLEKLDIKCNIEGNNELYNLPALKEITLKNFYLFEDTIASGNSIVTAFEEVDEVRVASESDSEAYKKALSIAKRAKAASEYKYKYDYFMDESYRIIQQIDNESVENFYKEETMKGNTKIIGTYMAVLTDDFFNEDQQPVVLYQETRETPSIIMYLTCEMDEYGEFIYYGDEPTFAHEHNKTILVNGKEFPVIAKPC